MKAKTIASAFMAVFLALVIFTVPVHAQAIPSLPHAFYGAVEVNGSPAPVGTEVEVRGEGVQTGVGNNPVTVTAAGSYGSSNPLEPKLVVQGDIADGTTLTFYVNGVPTGQTAVWHSGEVTELDVSVTGEIPPPGTTETPPPETTETPPPETTETPPPETTETPPPETAPEPTPEPAPELTPEPAPEPAPAPPAEPVNWPVLWGVIGGVIVVGLIIFLLARRKAY